MLLEPNVVVLYVDDIVKSSRFYQDLLGIKAVEDSTTFHSFPLTSGMTVALKAKHSMVPDLDNNSGCGELAFTVDSNNKVDELYHQWQGNGINIIVPPTKLPFGYSFVATDPDGQRLRVAFINQA